MSLYLRQSTASQEILLGPFVDSGDGDTAETSLTIANTDIKLWVEGATTLANKNSGGATHISNGYYYAVLDATDTATVGKLEVNVKVSGALAVKREYHVLEEAVYDAMFAASGTGVPAALSSLIATAQADLDIITGTDGATMATDQPNLDDLDDVMPGILAANPVGSVTGDVGGKVIGGGSGTITGTGARVVDGSGNAVMPASSYSAPPSASTVASAVRTELGTELGRIDAATSTRLASGSYTAPDNSTISTIATRIGTPATNLAAVIDLNLDAKVSEVEGGSGSSATLLQSTTIATLASQTSFTLTAGSADNDAYKKEKGVIFVITDQSTATQKAVVTAEAYVGSTRTVTLTAAPVFNIATGDTVDIIAAAYTPAPRNIIIQADT